MLGWELPPHNSGGLGVACYHLSKALAQEGATIDFVVPYSAPHDNIDYMEIHNATKFRTTRVAMSIFLAWGAHPPRVWPRTPLSSARRA